MSTTRQRTQASQDLKLEECDSNDDFDEDEDDRKRSSPQQNIIIIVVIIVILLYFFKTNIQSTISNLYSSSSDTKIFEVNSFEQKVSQADTIIENTEEESTSNIIITPNVVVSDVNTLPEEIPPRMSIEEQTKKCDELIENIRSLKYKGVVMEVDEGAKTAINQLQAELRKLFRLQYGPNTSKFKVEMKLEFPSTMPDFAEAGKSGIILIETAPIDLVPYSVYLFLQTIKNFKGGAFHRNAGHVLQAQVNTDGVRGMAFQEYHKDFPHKRLTMGYAGRPGGPAFYISTVDNTGNHGPGSQGALTSVT